MGAVNTNFQSMNQLIQVFDFKILSPFIINIQF